jgi:hypothetical protein
MAGSKRWFRYTTDAGVNYSVELDESNSESIVNESLILMPSREANYPYIPRRLRMRYWYAETTGTRRLRRKFYVGDILTIASGGENPIISARAYPDNEPENWRVTAYRGERSAPTPPVNLTGGDTGLNDGDQGRDQA